MERGARRSKRLRDEDIVEEVEELEKCEAGLKQRVTELERALAVKTMVVVKLEEDQGKLEVEREQALSILKEQESLVKCPVCLMLPREDKPVPCCPQGHFVCLPCKDRLVRHPGSLYLLHKRRLSTEVYKSPKNYVSTQTQKRAMYRNPGRHYPQVILFLYGPPKIVILCKIELETH